MDRIGSTRYIASNGELYSIVAQATKAASQAALAANYARLGVSRDTSSESSLKE